MAIVLNFEDSTAYPPVTLTGQKIIIGRSSKAGLRLSDPMCSGLHASIEINAEGNVVVVDLESTNGTYLNESLLTTPMRIYIDDVVRIGDTRFWLDKNALNPREAKILGAGSNKTSFTKINLPGVSSQTSPQLSIAKPAPKARVSTARPSLKAKKAPAEEASPSLMSKLKNAFKRNDESDD